MSEVLVFIGFIVELIFFIWFSATLSGIHKESRRTNDLLARSNEIQSYYGEIMRSYEELAKNGSQRVEKVGRPPALP
jgi:hypothetical protein